MNESDRILRSIVIRNDPFKLLKEMDPEVIFTYVYYFYRSIANDKGLSVDEGDREFAQMADVAADFLLDAYKLMYFSFVDPPTKKQKYTLSYLDPGDILTYLYNTYLFVSQDPGILYSPEPEEQNIAFAAGTMAEYINRAFEVLYGHPITISY